MDTSHLEQISATRRDIAIRWLVPDRVIFVVAEGEINTPVRNWMNARILYLMHSCSTPHIHVISDMSRMTHIPLSTLAQPDPLRQHPRRGWLISVGEPKTRLLKLLARFMSLRYRVCKTLDEALNTLQQLDPSLPDLHLYPPDEPALGKRSS